MSVIVIDGISLPDHTHGLVKDTAADWALENPVLALAQEGYEQDTERKKIGDGTSAWTALPYVFDAIVAATLFPQVVPLGKFGTPVGDGTTANTTLIAAAEADPSPVIWVPPGIYMTTAAFVFKRYVGPGQIKTNGATGHAMAPAASFITAAPTPSSNDDSRDIVFDGDFSKAFSAEHVTIVNASTLGTPSTGYKNNVETSAHFLIYENDGSGHNESTSSADGRTATAAYNTRLYQGGTGDFVGHTFYGEIFTPTPGSNTHWLANPALTVLNAAIGITGASSEHMYLNPFETDLADGGHDTAAVGWVMNMGRTVDTAAWGEVWIGNRIQSYGSKAIDVGYSISGPAKRGVDLSQATYATDKAALTLKADDRIYLKATTAALNGINWYATTAGTEWLDYNSTLSAVEIGSGGATALAVSADGTAVNYLHAYSRATTKGPVLAAEGSDTNVSMLFVTQGTGGVTFASGSEASPVSQFFIQSTASAVNFLKTVAAVTGSPAKLVAGGTDTNIDLRISPQGTGTVDLNPVPSTTTAPSAGAAGALPATPTGYATVKVNGTNRKIAYY